jgi:hypothetical protein
MYKWHEDKGGEKLKPNVMLRVIGSDGIEYLFICNTLFAVVKKRFKIWNLIL